MAALHLTVRERGALPPNRHFRLPPCCRLISITMARVWAALSGWEKARLLGSLLLMGAG